MICRTRRTLDRNGSPRPAVFLDRDGTLTEYQGFITEPSQLRLIGGACETLNSLHTAGFAVVLVTNQSVIGRGMITDDQLHDGRGWRRLVDRMGSF